MSSPQSPIWQLVEPVVREAGFVLFDLEAPSGRGGSGGVLRVYISKSSKESVLLDECAVVSRKIDELTALDALIPGSYVLEVSSPGVNRKLSRPEHFEGAVGERVKLVTDDSDGQGGRAVRGTLLRFESGVLEVQDEEKKSSVSVELAHVKRAQVDFQFGSK